MDGYTEILLAHQTVLKRLFEIQTLDPLIEAIHVFEPMLDCVTQLREVYSDYFLDLADRRHVLEMTEMTFMSITDVCTLSAERRIWTDDDQIKAMFRPHHMDIVPITLKDLTDVPLHYCEFLGTALHKFLNILNISASSAALHNVCFPSYESFMIYKRSSRKGSRFWRGIKRCCNAKVALSGRTKWWRASHYPCIFVLTFLVYRA